MNSNCNLHAGFLHLPATSGALFTYFIRLVQIYISLRLISYYKAAGERAKVATNLKQSKDD